jgi:hypothetical protein
MSPRLANRLEASFEIFQPPSETSAEYSLSPAAHRWFDAAVVLDSDSGRAEGE